MIYDKTNYTGLSAHLPGLKHLLSLNARDLKTCTARVWDTIWRYATTHEISRDRFRSTIISIRHSLRRFASLERKIVNYVDNISLTPGFSTSTGWDGTEAKRSGAKGWQLFYFATCKHQIASNTEIRKFFLDWQ